MPFASSDLPTADSRQHFLAHIVIWQDVFHMLRIGFSLRLGHLGAGGNHRADRKADRTGGHGRAGAKTPVVEPGLVTGRIAGGKAKLIEHFLGRQTETPTRGHKIRIGLSHEIRLRPVGDENPDNGRGLRVRNIHDRHRFWRCFVGMLDHRSCTAAQ